MIEATCNSECFLSIYCAESQVVYQGKRSTNPKSLRNTWSCINRNDVGFFSSESQSLKTRRNNRTNTWKNFTESVMNLKNKLLHWEKSWIIHQGSIWNSLEGKYHILVLVVEESDCWLLVLSRYRTIPEPLKLLCDNFMKSFSEEFLSHKSNSQILTYNFLLADWNLFFVMFTMALQFYPMLRVKWKKS